MSVGASRFAVSSPGEERIGVPALRQQRKLEFFFTDVERRALRIAEIAVRDRDEAMDIVQDAMIKLARKYSLRPVDEWPPLFYRILQNGIRDWHRRQSVRNRVMVLLGRAKNDEVSYDPVGEAADPAGRTPDELLENDEAMGDLEVAIGRLPTRQREAFTLRTFEGLDVAATALAMDCSQGSVKTHYSRAVHSLRETLGEHWQ